MLCFTSRASGVLRRGIAVSLVAIGWEAAARAEKATPFRVDYSAPSSCPDEASLVSRIRARVDVRQALPGESIPTFGVTLRNEGERVVGRIASMSERREPTSREVSGTDCSDVVDAVALIVTMAIAPGARIAGAPSPAARANFGSIAGPNANDTGTDSTQAAAAEKAEPSAGPKADRPVFKLLASAQAEATLAFVPTTVLGVGGRIQLFRTSSYIGGPSLAVGFITVPAIERQMNIGRASLGFNVGELFACPVSFSLSRAVAFLPCGRVDAGRIEATGMDIPNAHTRNLVWASVGALGQIAFVPVKPLVIDAQASLIVPLTPYKFVFSPESVIYGAQSVGFSTSLAIGVMFL